MKIVKKILFICMILIIAILSFLLIKERKNSENKCLLKNTEECIRVIEETIFDLEMENNDWGEEL